MPRVTKASENPQRTEGVGLREETAENKSCLADVDVKLLEFDAMIKKLSRRKPGQLIKTIASLEDLHLSILHTYMTTMEQTVLYSFNVKASFTFVCVDAFSGSPENKLTVSGSVSPFDNILFLNLNMNSQTSYGVVGNSNEEKRVIEKARSLLNWLTERNFDKIKDEIVQTIIRASPSAFVIKSLVCFILDMAMVDSTANVLFARLSVHLFHSLPPFPSADCHGEITTFERLFLCKCRMELEHSSPETDRHAPLVYVDESDCWRFIKTVRLLAEIFKNRMLSQTTRQSIIQVLMNPIFPPERNTDSMNCFLSFVGVLADFQFCDENFKQLVQNSRSWRAVTMNKSRKEAEDALARNEGALDLMKRLLESYKEDKCKLHLHAQGLEQKYQNESKLRRETECALAIERESIAKVRLRLETLENEHNNLRLKAEELETNYTGELILRKESEIALDKERNELEAMTQVFETCKIEQENLTSQVRTWQDKYDQELSVRKETEDSLSRQKEELEIVKGLLEAYNQEADAMREERDSALQTVQELTRKHLEERQPPPSFFCPITQEVMKDPHFAADGFTYEAEAIKKWFSTGHDTSPMTNLKLPHRNLVPNRALRSAIQDLS
ncbi:hypothetical protein Bca52824_081700 [Brassica carinata]|uniref:RING-type E3 ubiquitin transferase n=1 Tax=Brassica carinata TaxID=52824 RepID=A0A8X7TRV5_BRACI|nr:hypothetical protein Bca52824_081700 [Brassica carinata]